MEQRAQQSCGMDLMNGGLWLRPLRAENCSIASLFIQQFHNSAWPLREEKTSQPLTSLSAPGPNPTAPREWREENCWNKRIIEQERLAAKQKKKWSYCGTNKTQQGKRHEMETNQELVCWNGIDVRQMGLRPITHSFINQSASHSFTNSIK